MRDRQTIDRIRLDTLDTLIHDQTKKAEYSRADYPYLWYSFIFGEKRIQIRKGKKGYYLAGSLDLLKSQREEISLQSKGLFFRTKEEKEFKDVCIQWQKIVKSVLS